MLKALKKPGIEGTFFSIIKATNDKPIANIIPNGKKLKPFSINLRTRQRCPPPTLFQFNTGILS
jgi:hypothetical protein